MKKYFVSFSGEDDAKIAKYLTSEMNRIFARKIEFFSSATHLRPGQDWLEEVHRAIESSEAILPILGLNTFQNPWINIEFGAFWAARKKIHPLLHSGLTVELLHRPMNDSQVTAIDSPNGIIELVDEIRKEAKISRISHYNANEISTKISQIGLGSSFAIRSAAELSKQADISVRKMSTLNLSDCEIEVEAPGALVNYTLKDETEVVLNGTGVDALLLRFVGTELLNASKNIIIEIDNSQRTRLSEYGQFFKLTLNQIPIAPILRFQQHALDQQYVGRADGYFPYSLAEIHLSADLLPELQLVFWRATVADLKIKVHYI